MLSYAALLVVLAVPLLVVYFASSEVRERVYVRTGIEIEASIMERVLRGSRFDSVVVTSGYVPTATKGGVPVQGLLPVVRFVSKLVGRFDNSDAFTALQLEAGLEPLRDVVARVVPPGLGGACVAREDVEFATNTLLSLHITGCFGFLMGQSRRTVLDDCWHGAMEWIFAQREWKDLDLMHELDDIVWMKEVAALVPVDSNRGSGGSGSSAGASGASGSSGAGASGADCAITSTRSGGGASTSASGGD